MPDRDAPTLTDDNPMTTYAGPRIEVAWNPATRRWEDIWPESEGYDWERKIPMVWCLSAGRDVTIPTD